MIDVSTRIDCVPLHAAVEVQLFHFLTCVQVHEELMMMFFNTSKMSGVATSMSCCCRGFTVLMETFQ